MQLRLIVIISVPLQLCLITTPTPPPLRIPGGEPFTIKELDEIKHVADTTMTDLNEINFSIRVLLNTISHRNGLGPFTLVFTELLKLVGERRS